MVPACLRGKGLVALLGLIVMMSSLTIVLTASPVVAAVPIVKIVGSSTTVRPNSPIPVSATSSATIAAAKNEFESFQVIVQAPPDDSIVGLRVDPGASITAPGGANIPVANVSIYREHNYNAAQRSDLEGAAGLWPDALIPETDYFYQENRSAFPVDVQPGQRVVAWVDVLVPKDQPEGTYTGSISVSAIQGGVRETVATVPVALTVFDFSIPSTSSLATVFPIQDSSQPCFAHTGSQNCVGDAQMRWRLHSLYARAGLENRVSISNPWPLGQDAAPPTGANLTMFNQYTLPLIEGRSPQDTSLSSDLRPIRLGAFGGAGAKLTSLHIYSYRDWHCIGTCPEAWENFAEDPNGNGTQADSFVDRLLIYACDEPGNSAASWNACEPYGMSSSTDLAKLVTVTAQDAKAVGHLDDIDALVPLVNYMVGKDCCGSRYIGNQRNHQDYKDFLDPAVHNTNTSPPNRLWMYVSNMSHGSDDDSASSLWEGWPGYAIDAPALQARAMGWLSFAYNTTGELYYDTTTKLHSAWRDQYEAGGNGDGTLFYPGVPAGRGNVGDSDYALPIGGTNPIPVESIRLKRIRDAREDYEYLRILEDAGERAFGMNMFSQLFVNPSTGEFDMDTALFAITGSSSTLTQATIEQAKLDLATRIESGSGPATLLDSGPSGTVSSSTATFTFSSSKPNSTFACSLDGAAYGVCTSPKQYTELVPGSHTFRVRATDSSGNTDPTPAERTWTVVDATTVYQADGLIKRSGDYPYKGNNVYNLTGSNQTWKLTAQRGSKRTFLIRVQNDGEATDSFSIVGSKVNGFTTKYFLGARNITTSVVAGERSTGTLAPGAERTIKMTVQAKSNARRTTHLWRIHAVSYRAQVDNDQDIRDVVRLSFKVK